MAQDPLLRSTPSREARSANKGRLDVIVLILVLQVGAAVIGWVAVTRNARISAASAVESRSLAQQSAAVASVLERATRGDPSDVLLEQVREDMPVVAWLIDDQRPVAGPFSGVARLSLLEGGELPLSRLARGIMRHGWLETRSGETYLSTVTRLPDGRVLVVGQPESFLLGAQDGAWAGVAVRSAVTWGVCLGLSWLACVWLFVRDARRSEAVRASLQSEVAGRVRDATRARDALIFGLAKLADFRDTDTGAHLDRISVFVRLLARSARRRNARFEERVIDDTWIERLAVASSLHDIGKVGIPDAVLLKPGRLTPDERVLIEKHPEIGARTIEAVREKLGDDALVDMAHEIALGHHEHWDGRGYPNRLVGSATPLSARFVALADVYDALTSERVYKRAMTHEQARSIIVGSSGTHFDPQVVEAFLDVEEQFDRLRGEGLAAAA